MGIGEGFLHAFHTLDGDACVSCAVETEDGGIDFCDPINRVFGCEFGWIAFEPTIPCGGGFDFWTVCTVQPRDSTAPTKTRDGEFGWVDEFLTGSVGHAGIQVAHHLGIGDFTGDVLLDVLNVAQGRHITLADE